MKFRTEIDINPFDAPIDYESRVLAVGSCFAASIGGELQRAKFRTDVNPTGALFNPASIARTLERFAECRMVGVEELSRSREGWFHYDFHSSVCCGESAEMCAESINRAIERGHKALRESDWVILTLGTAWIYELKESGEVVANCHKEPASTFVRRRMEVSEIVAILTSLMDGALRGKRVILTLSPIRHIADGLAENSLSKATLRVAIEAVAECYPQRINYFPAYEILMDDLRDYRFYGADMVHPSATAVEYIWERFQGVAIGEGARKIMSRVMKIVRGVEHRPLDVASEGYQKFCRSQLDAIAQLPDVDLSAENCFFTEQLEKKS